MNYQEIKTRINARVIELQKQGKNSEEIFQVLQKEFIGELSEKERIKVLAYIKSF